MKAEKIYLAITRIILKLLNNKEEDTMKKIKINGMSCQHCAIAVTKALNAVEGIKNVQVDLGSGVASFEEEHNIDAQIIAAAVQKAGYDIVE